MWAERPLRGDRLLGLSCRRLYFRFSRERIAFNGVRNDGVLQQSCRRMAARHHLLRAGLCHFGVGRVVSGADRRVGRARWGGWLSDPGTVVYAWPGPGASFDALDHTRRVA